MKQLPLTDSNWVNDSIPAPSSPLPPPPISAAGEDLVVDSCVQHKTMALAGRLSFAREQVADCRISASLPSLKSRSIIYDYTKEELCKGPPKREGGEDSN